MKREISKCHIQEKMKKQRSQLQKKLFHQMANTMEQRDTTFDKSDAVLKEEKLADDTNSNIVLIDILNRPSLIKNIGTIKFERSG